jgi:ADP-ribose pyrophosphatase
MNSLVPENQGAEDGGKVISSQEIYSGKEISFRLQELLLPDGRSIHQELLIYPATVCVAPYTDDGRFVLLQQYRHSTGRAIWEAPAGKLLQGEEPDAGARRELEEETGYRAARWERLFAGYIAPGISTEWMSFFLARGLTSGARRPEADEFIHVHEVPADTVLCMVHHGEIQDVKSVLVLILALEKLQKGP